MNGKKIVDYATSGYGSNRVNHKCCNTNDVKRCNQIGVSGHAERVLLNRYLKSKKNNKKKVKKNKYTLVVVRLTSKGELALAKPCSLCVPIIKMAKISHIWYSIDGGWKYENSAEIKGIPSSGTIRMLT